MGHFIRYGMPRKGGTSTVGSLLKYLLEMLDVAFQESVAIIDDLIRQQVRNLERYGRFIGDAMLTGGEVSIHDARKIVHIRHPKYNRLSNSIIVSKVSKLRSSLRKSGGECFGFRQSNVGGYLSTSIESCFSNDDYPPPSETDSRNGFDLTSDLLSFEENQRYEERYLLSNEILDYYCYDNQEYNLVFLGFQKEYELGMLEDFQNGSTSPDFNVGSDYSRLGFINEPQVRSSSNSSPNPTHGKSLSLGSNSNLNSSSILNSISIPTPSPNSTPSSIFTLQNSLQAPKYSSNRLVNRSISILKPGKEIQTKLVTKDGVFAQVFESVGYSQTSSFFTANSLE